MNSLKYLPVNRSLDSGQDVVGRFRMRDDCLLPRFGGEDNTNKIESGKEAQASWWRRILRLFWPAPDPFESRERTGTRPDAKPADWLQHASTGKPVQPVDVKRDREPLDAEKSGMAPNFGPAQTEFRFENVTVVCNDLHDADFEIVSRPSRPRAESPAPAVGMLLSA